MNRERFHPQFLGILEAFERNAPKFLIQWNDTLARAQSTDRPVILDESLLFNAAVGRANDGYAAYSVNAGTVAALFDLSRTLCATERFVDEIPITGKAMQTRTIRGSSHFLDYSELIGAHGRPLPLIPLREIFQDPPREQLGFLFLDLLFRFLLMHEQMHFVRGHLHYLYGANSPRAYDEVPRTPTTRVESIDNKALELDADGSALFFMLDAYEHGLHSNIIVPLTTGRYVAASAVASLFSDQWGWARLVGLAALSVMMLLSLTDSANLSHPRVQTRMLNLLGTHETYLRRKFDFAAMAKPHPSVFQFFRDVATVALTLQTPPPDQEALIEWKTVKAAEFKQPACIELRDLQKRLMELAPKLR